MSRAILQLGNSANWRQVWTSSIVAARAADGGYIPIPPFSCPIVIQSRIVVVYTYSTKAKPAWKIAGNIARKIRAGVLVGGGFDTTIADLRLLRLGRNNLYIFTAISAEYELEISPKYWIEDLEVAIFEYTGIDSDTLTEQLNRIESDLDAILR